MALAPLTSPYHSASEIMTVLLSIQLLDNVAGKTMGSSTCREFLAPGLEASAPLILTIWGINQNIEHLSLSLSFFLFLLLSSFFPPSLSPSLLPSICVCHRKRIYLSNK